MRGLHLFYNPYSVSSKVVRSLVASDPVRAADVHARLSSSGFTCSYQTVVKSLGALCDEGLLTREGNQYAVDTAWIREVKSFVVDLPFDR